MSNMSEKKFSQEIISMIGQAGVDNANNFEVLVHDGNAAGQGYLGEMAFVSVTNKITKEILNIVVKQAIPSENQSNRELMTKTFFNEIYFYKTIWPMLDEFQKSFPSFQPLDKIPKFYGSSSTLGSEKLVLENLKSLGFDMFPRNASFNDSHMKLLLTSYGKFHGLSTAFRILHPEETRKIRNELGNPVEDVLKTDIMSKYTLYCLKEVENMVENEDIKKKLKRYTERGMDIALECLKYTGKNPVLKHGDCWSNNMLFKFDDNGYPVDFRMVDFQMCQYGSVVADLAYLIYSGATKDILDKLDHYLRIYLDSFSNTLQHFGLDSSKIFTFDDLKQEWKEYCAGGFVVGQMTWRSKLAKSYDKRNLMEINDDLNRNGSIAQIDPDRIDQLDLEENRLRQILLDLFQHLYDNDYL